MSEQSDKPYDGKNLRDILYDSIAAARTTIRVGNAKSTAEDTTSFFVSFVMQLDNQTYRRLCDVADKRERSMPRLLRRYIKEGFKECLADEELDDDEAQKQAA
jgi:hypothetical protein